MKEKINGIKWYWLLNGFCKKEDCFIVTDLFWKQKFIDLDHPINQFMGEHYFKVNITSSSLGHKVSRGKRHLLVHRSLIGSLSPEEYYHFAHCNQIIPYSFSKYLEYKDKAKALRQAKREEYKSIINERMKNPAYAKKVAQNKKRDEWIIKTKKKNKENPTKSEALLLKTALKRFGKRVKFQHEITIGSHIYFLDFYIKSLNVAIEVDGGYHSTIEQSVKDRERDENLASVGIKTIRIKNEQVPIKACIEELLSVLQNRKKKNGKRADISIDTYFIGQAD